MVSMARMAASEPIGSQHARPGSTRQRSGAREAERAEPHIDRAPAARGRADDPAVVAPGPAADDPEAWVAAREPRRPVRWRAVVGLVPAILNPLPDVAVHVVKPPRIRLE